VKLFSKNSNLCDHNPPTLQTDGQTDKQTTCDRKTALCTKVHRAVKTVWCPGNDRLNRKCFRCRRKVSTIWQSVTSHGKLFPQVRDPATLKVQSPTVSQGVFSALPAAVNSLTSAVVCWRCRQQGEGHQW